jgi:hypothetical protein
MAAGIGIALWLSPAPAPAQMTTDQCVDSNARAQHLRTEGKLREARQELRTCADPSCPALVRNDCTKRLDDAETAQPTIAFEVKDASGGDLTAVRVTVDGQPLADSLGGTALAVDPGQHVFTFEAAGLPPATRTLVLTEGEKGRRERLVLEGAKLATTTPVSPVTPERSFPAIEAANAGRGGTGSQKVFGLVVGGVGVAGIAVGSVFGALAFSERNQQVSDCGSATTCTPAGHSRAVSERSTGIIYGTVSDVGFIAGGALLLGGVVLFLSGGSAPRPAPAAGMWIAPMVGASGGGVLLRGEL